MPADIPQRPADVQQNLRLGPGSAHTHRDVFHIPGLLLSLFWLLEKGSDNWLNVWNADGDYVACSAAAEGDDWKRDVVAFAWLH